MLGERIQKNGITKKKREREKHDCKEHFLVLLTLKYPRNYRKMTDITKYLKIKRKYYVF